MHIAVFGAGAVGGYFGGRLAQAGEDVVFIARGDHLKAMQTRGLRVDSIEGNFVIDPVHATDDPTEIGVADAVLVSVKAGQVSEAAEAMRPMVGPETFVVPLENGVEAPSQLAEVLGKQHVLGGLCRIISALVAPGHIRHSGISPTITFGELDRRRSTRADRLRQAFDKAEGVTPHIPSDIRVALWEKFLFIAALSGVGAVTRAPVGVLRSLPETRRLLEEAMAEILAVAQALGIALSPETVTETMAFVDGLPASGTASMQRDVMAGRPSELESQNGAVVRLGREAGVETPMHSFIYHSLLPQELRVRGQL
ncbi:MAG: 2-dehydropantoate 2-reductase [Anaerolineae bacterium]|jgi:2-dehydropantoate 2-reductase